MRQLAAENGRNWQLPLSSRPPFSQRHARRRTPFCLMCEVIPHWPPLMGTASSLSVIPLPLLTSVSRAAFLLRRTRQRLRSVQRRIVYPPDARGKNAVSLKPLAFSARNLSVAVRGLAEAEVVIAVTIICDYICCLKTPI